jgi:hypothetical protein
VLKLGDVQHNAFQKLISQHHKLTETLGSLRNEAGPVSHGKEGFILRLSSYHRRAAVLSADAIVAFLHHAYLETELDLARTREPYEQFQRFHVSIDRHASVAAEVDDDGYVTLTVRLPNGEEFPVVVEPSRLLFHLDRTAYVEALRAGQEADGHLPDVFDVVLPPSLAAQEGGTP